MKKIVLVVWLVATASVTAFPLEWGLKAGPSFSRFYFTEGIGQGWQSYAAFQIGAFADVRIFKTLILRPELLFSRLGGEFTSMYGGSEVRLRERLDYLVLPFLLRFETPLFKDAAIRFCGGVYGAAMIGAKTVMRHAGETYKEDLRREINSFDYGYCLGLEIGWKKYILELRYNGGLSDIKKYHQSVYSIYLSSLAVLLGYRF